VASEVKIREVDGTDDEIAQDIKDLHKLTFGETAPVAETDYGYWWLAYDNDVYVAFAGLVQSSYGPGIGYLKRTGVVEPYRGEGLHLRFLRVRERKAIKLGWQMLITDTTSNPASANNLIKAGYRIFEPEYRWAFQNSIYWRKPLHGNGHTSKQTNSALH
jgi:GNAT superfamily N-acetyltransferase